MPQSCLEFEDPERLTHVVIGTGVEPGNGLGSITAQITNIEHLQKLLYKLEYLKEVRTVFRVTKREARVSG
jgi:hypothetical protein